MIPGLPAIAAVSLADQAALLRHRALSRIAASIGTTPAQLAIAWLLAQDGVITIPQSSNVAHVSECRRAAGLRLSHATLGAIDAAFPPPTNATPLAML